MAEGNPEGRARRANAPEDDSPENDSDSTVPASLNGDAVPESRAADALAEEAGTVAASDDRPPWAPDPARSGVEGTPDPDPLPHYVRYRWLSIAGAVASGFFAWRRDRPDRPKPRLRGPVEPASVRMGRPHCRDDHAARAHVARDRGLRERPASAPRQPRHPVVLFQDGLSVRPGGEPGFGNHRGPS